MIAESAPCELRSAFLLIELWLVFPRSPWDELSNYEWSSGFNTRIVPFVFFLGSMV